MGYFKEQAIIKQEKRLKSSSSELSNTYNSKKDRKLEYMLGVCFDCKNLVSNVSKTNCLNTIDKNAVCSYTNTFCTFSRSSLIHCEFKNKKKKDIKILINKIKNMFKWINDKLTRSWKVIINNNWEYWNELQTDDKETISKKQ